MSRICKVRPVVFTEPNKVGDLNWMAENRDDKTAFITFDVQDMVKTGFVGIGTAALRPYNQHRTDGETPFVYSIVVGENGTTPYRFGTETMYEYKRLVAQEMRRLIEFLRRYGYTRLVVPVVMVAGKPEIATRISYFVDPRLKEWIMEGFEDLCLGDM